MKVHELRYFPRNSGPVDDRILDPIRRKILLGGKGASGVIELSSEELRVSTTKKDQVVMTFDRETCISRMFVSSSLELDELQKHLGEALYGCLFSFFSGAVPQQYQDELVTEVKNLSSYLPEEKSRELAFFARDEVGLDKIIEGLEPQGSVS